jgi:hypothetical protein
MKAADGAINRRKRARAMRTMQIGQITRISVNQKPAIQAVSPGADERPWKFEP